MGYIIQINEKMYLKNSKYDTEDINEARVFETEEKAKKYLNHHCEGTAEVKQIEKEKGTQSWKTKQKYQSI